MKKFLLTMLLVAVSVNFFGQNDRRRAGHTPADTPQEQKQGENRQVEGILIDRDTEEALPMTTVQLLKTDSTYVAGTITDEHGLFVIQAPENGQYLLRISSVGYVTSIKRLEIVDNKDLNMGKVVLGADAVMLKGVTATAQALKVTMVEDTFVYNSAAYRTPEGSAVEELVKLLPGAQVDDSGNITINGKQVKKIKVDGKEFMNGDAQTALKNLPTSIIDQIQAYEADSDQKRITGIDDGEQEMTLNFKIKKGMNKGLVGQADMGYGTHDRYAERIMGMVFKDNLQLGLFTNFNNTNNQGFGGRGGGFRGRQGLNTANMVGLNFGYEKANVIKWNGSVRWNHGTSDNLTKSSSENFVIGNQNFSNSLSQNYSKNKSWNANMRVEWTPDSVTTISFRPNFSWNDSDSRSGSMSAMFDEDPYSYGFTDPLQEIDDIAAKGIARNHNTGSGLSYNYSKSMNGWLQLNRRLSSKGRNVALSFNGSYSESTGQNFSTSNMRFFNGKTDDYSIHRYNRTPSKNWNYNSQISYSEPVSDRTYLQFSYKFTRSSSQSNRATYDFSDLTTLPADFVNLYSSLGFSNIPEYRLWTEYLPNDYTAYEDKRLSRFTEYNTFTHDIEIQFRRVRDEYNYNFGILAQPQNTKLKQHYLNTPATVKRSVFNITPTANFRYNFSKQHQLRFNYRGNTSQPSISQLINITDDSDPMNITVGNPDLKPAFTNRFDIRYNNFIQNHFQSISANANFNTTRNSTASCSYYNPETGGHIRKQENVNGNWNAGANLRYAIAIDTLAMWNLSADVNYSFSNNVGLANTSQALSLADMQRYSTKVHNYGGRLALSYRNNWLNIEPDGNVSRTNSRNGLRPEASLNTWQFSYGGNMRIDLPWGMSLTTDIHNSSRRGYNDASLNTNELIWNAQVAQNFLRARNLTLSVEFYDILQNQSNLSRSINAQSRRDTEYNSINSFAMFHLIYRFQTMGGKKGEQQGPPSDRPDFGRPEMRGRGGNGGGMRPMGPPPGGMY